MFMTGEQKVLQREAGGAISKWAEVPQDDSGGRLRSGRCYFSISEDQFRMTERGAE
jgi:hypothetical protein